jgi:site-specific DNA-methyltransferase (adenine-specific)
MPADSDTPLLPGFTAAPSDTDFELHLGDCIEGLKQLPAESVDLVVTSPPYNLGIDYGKYDDSKTAEEYLEWSKQWTAAVKRVLKDDGALFLNIAGSPSNPWLPHEVILALREIFELQNTIHWIKSITVESDGEPVSAGHFKPINSKRYLNDCHEFIFHLTKDGNVPIDRLAVGVPYADKSNIRRWKHSHGRDKRCRGNNWFVPYKTINSRDKDRPHPATFPVQLAEFAIRLHDKKPEHITMLDPFVGIGHAALAAAQMNIDRFIGFDIDEAYLQEACERVGTEIRRPDAPPTA